MNQQDIKEIVVEAGKELVKKGLIARTWGNVSCRAGEDQFVITPSGRTYETLAPGEIVTVNIKDCSHEGSIEPSSEKGVHAEVYRQRPDINFVIHTHQPYASAISCLGIDIPVAGSEAKQQIGSQVISVPYALSGTKKLRNNIATALSRSESKAFLMVSHGAICLGENRDQAFLVAEELEKVCAAAVIGFHPDAGSDDKLDHDGLRDYYIRKMKNLSSAVDYPATESIYNSERSSSGFRLYLDRAGKTPFSAEGDDVFELAGNEAGGVPGKQDFDSGIEKAISIHREIYSRNRDVNALIHTTAPDILAVSRVGNTVYPLLDDFAQIIGTKAPLINISTQNQPGRAAANAARALKGRSAVMLNNNGALCAGPSISDALAAGMILDKNCKAVIASALSGLGKPINPLECLLMRYVYLKRYSKKAVSGK